MKERSLQIKVKYNSIDYMNLYTFEPGIEWFESSLIEIMYIYI